MNRIDRVFESARRTGKKILIPFLTGGDPDLSTTERLIPVLADSGADIVEVGIPFSDPMADGPTIQLSSERALSAGTTLASLLEMVCRVRASCNVPIVLMGYYNPIFRLGVPKFVDMASQAGVDGLLVVDLPPEESRDLARCCRRKNIALIRLITPTSDRDRIVTITQDAGGYLYYVSVTGVTGVRHSLPPDLAERISLIRRVTSLPVVIGFGISTPELARAAAEAADGVVVGSALVKLFETNADAALADAVGRFVSSFREAMDRRD